MLLLWGAVLIVCNNQVTRALNMKRLLTLAMATSLLSTTTLVSAAKFRIMEGMDWYGADIAKHAGASLEGCRDWCKRTSDCDIFTFKKSDRLCFMKRDSGGRWSEDSNAISGIKL